MLTKTLKKPMARALNPNPRAVQHAQKFVDDLDMTLTELVELRDQMNDRIEEFETVKAVVQRVTLNKVAA